MLSYSDVIGYAPPMDLPDFLRFTPVPLRRTHNGWSPEQQRDFILAMARGMGVRQAASKLGFSRQSAYMLRRKPGAQSFVAAWDRAIDFARDARVAGNNSCGFGNGEIEMLLVPRYYAGRLIGFVQRPDYLGALRTLRQLDRIAEQRQTGAATRPPRPGLSRLTRIG